MTNEELKTMMAEYAEDKSMFTDDDFMFAAMKHVLWNSLTEADRRIIIIYAETGSLRKTAKLIGVSVGTISSKIHKIQDTFKKCISH